MAVDLFRVLEGIQIEDASGADNSISAGAHISILQGTGLPGGDTGDQDAAGIGSVYSRRDAEVDNLQLYYKWSTAGNSSADWKEISSKDYVDAIAQGLSWREPALVLDDTAYANIAAAESAANGGNTVDGIGISVGNRLLFTNLTTGNDNVYIVSGSAGAWTFTEDTNLATDGDAILVQDGTWADTQWVFDGTNWIQFGGGGAANAAEIAFIRTYIGKTGPGAELPTYTAENLIVNNSDNLEVAINKLDIGFGTGTITNTGGAWAISDNLAFAGTNGAAGTLDVTGVLNELNNTIGDRTYTNDNVVVDGEAVATSIDALDTAIGNLQSQTLVSTGSVTTTPGTLFTVDTIPLALADQIKWMVEIRNNTTPVNRRAMEVHAITDGTLTDKTQFSILKLGAGVPGAGFDVSVSGTDLILQLKATGNYDYAVKRISFSHF